MEILRLRLLVLNQKHCAKEIKTKWSHDQLMFNRTVMIATNHTIDALIVKFTRYRTANIASVRDSYTCR